MEDKNYIKMLLNKGFFTEEQKEELSTHLNGLMQEYVKAGKDEEEQEHRLKCYQLFWDALGDSEFFKQKEQMKVVDLEEAAEEYASDYPAYNNEQVIAKYAFKRGAEWMAKQGYSLEYIIQYGFGVSDTSTKSKKATLSFPLPADIFDGDRVILQIRKK